MEVTLRRIPISGWRRCIHEAAAFDSAGEYAAALLFDDSPKISWWFRNDPPLLRIPSPAGYFEPDFVYLASRDGAQTLGILEIKADVFWNGEGSEARIKANACREWVRTINETSPSVLWEFGVVLDQDAINSTSFEVLRDAATLLYPDDRKQSTS